MHNLRLSRVLCLLLFAAHLGDLGCGRTRLDGRATPSEPNTGGTATGVASGSSGSDTNQPWRQNYQPFCPSTGEGAGVLDVWSDARGVFVLASFHVDSSYGSPTIWTNTGSGWNTMYAWPNGANGGGWLKGFPNGPFVVYSSGVASSAGDCPIQFIDEGVASCSGAQSVDALAVVSSDLAYAVHGDHLLRFGGNFWTQMGAPLPPVDVLPWSLWADAATIVVAATGHVGVIPSGGDPSWLKGSPEAYSPEVWAFGASDIWVGSFDGKLYHHDGVKWSLRASISGDCRAIKRLWGSGGSLFVMTDTLFGRWDGTGITTLSSLACPAFPVSPSTSYRGLWGNSATEVFVVIGDETPETTGCGAQVQWFNGSVVSPL